MEIGQIFVTLGLKGAGKTNSELKKTQDNIMGLSKKSLGAIAALAGVSFGLSAIYQRAINTGVGLNKFSNFTGKSSKELQKWQYIATTAGVAAAEVENTFRGLSQIGADFDITGNFPAELEAISKVIGGFDISRLGDADYMLRNLQKYLQSGAAPQNILNSMVSGLIGPDMTQFLNKNKLDPSNVPDSAIMSDRGSAALARTKVEFDKFIKDIEVRFARLFTKIGPKVLPQLKELAIQVVDLTEAIVNFLSNNKVFEMLGSVIKALTYALKGNLFAAAEEMAKFGDMQANVMRGGWYEDTVKKYVTPVVSPLTNLADSAVSNIFDVTQNIIVEQRSSRDEAIKKYAKDGLVSGYNEVVRKKSTSQSK